MTVALVDSIYDRADVRQTGESRAIFRTWQGRGVVERMTAEVLAYLCREPLLQRAFVGALERKWEFKAALTAAGKVRIPKGTERHLPSRATPQYFAPEKLKRLVKGGDDARKFADAVAAIVELEKTMEKYRNSEVTRDDLNDEISKVEKKLAAIPGFGRYFKKHASGDRLVQGRVPHPGRELSPMSDSQRLHFKELAGLFGDVQGFQEAVVETTVDGATPEFDLRRIQYAVCRMHQTVKSRGTVVDVARRYLAKTTRVERLATGGEKRVVIASGDGTAVASRGDRSPSVFRNAQHDEEEVRWTSLFGLVADDANDADDDGSSPSDSEGHATQLEGPRVGDDESCASLERRSTAVSKLRFDGRDDRGIRRFSVLEVASRKWGPVTMAWLRNYGFERTMRWCEEHPGTPKKLALGRAVLHDDVADGAMISDATDASPSRTHELVSSLPLVVADGTAAGDHRTVLASTAVPFQQGREHICLKCAWQNTFALTNDEQATQSWSGKPMYLSEVCNEIQSRRLGYDARPLALEPLPRDKVEQSKVRLLALLDAAPNAPSTTAFHLQLLDNNFEDTHVVVVHQGAIFDSNKAFALPLSARGLDACAGGAGRTCIGLVGCLVVSMSTKRKRSLGLPCEGPSRRRQRE